MCVCVCVCVCETKTCVYNFDPLKPHCYIVKLRFIGVYIIFLISAQNLKCVCVRSASPRQFERVPTIYVWSRNMKNIRIFIWFFFSFFIQCSFYHYYFYNFCSKTDCGTHSNRLAEYPQSMFGAEIWRISEFFIWQFSFFFFFWW